MVNYGMRASGDFASVWQTTAPPGLILNLHPRVEIYRSPAFANATAMSGNDYVLLSMRVPSGQRDWLRRNSGHPQVIPVRLSVAPITTPPDRIVDDEQRIVNRGDEPIMSHKQSLLSGALIGI